MDPLNQEFLPLEFPKTASKTLSSIKTGLQKILSDQSFEENGKILSNQSESPLRIITLQELSFHDTADDCWIAINDYVYDCTKYVKEHPAGHEVLCEYAGMDATVAFRGSEHSKSAVKLLANYLIGELPPHEQMFRNKNGLKMKM